MFLGILIGLAAMGLMWFIVANSHKHDYELLFHRKINSFSKINIRYEDIFLECRGTTVIENTYASYHKCKKCGKVFVNISDGTRRTFFVDLQRLQNDIEAVMITEQREKDKKIFETVNDRLFPSSEPEKENVTTNSDDKMMCCKMEQ